MALLPLGMKMLLLILALLNALIQAFQRVVIQDGRRELAVSLDFPVQFLALLAHR